MQRRIALIIGVVLALIAMFMVKVYLDQQSNVIKKQTLQEISEKQRRQISVVVAKNDIEKGATITAEMLDIKVYPRQFVQPQAVTSPERIIDMVAVVSIAKDEQITLSKLLSPQQARGGALAMATPIGKRAIAIAVDNIAALMGMIRPGDYVDVIGLIPVPMQTPDGKQVSQVAVIPLFQNVLVLATGQQTARVSSGRDRYAKDGGTGASPMITLALSPQEANLIAFVQEQGKLRLTLRNVSDSKIEAVQPANWDTLFMHIMPKVQQQQKTATEPTAPKTQRTIEIYRGLNRESIAISN